jgi:putative nucleotidyltransferase with HDIG domain
MPHEQPTISVVAPIVREQKFLGVTFVDWNLTAIDDTLTELEKNLTPNTSMIAFDWERELVIAAPQLADWRPQVIRHGDQVEFVPRPLGDSPLAARLAEMRPELSGANHIAMREIILAGEKYTLFLGAAHQVFGIAMLVPQRELFAAADKALQAAVAMETRQKEELRQITIGGGAALVLFFALIGVLARQISRLAVTQAKNEVFFSVIKTMVNAIDAKDPTTGGHSLRVAALAKELALALGLNETDANNIYLGGLLHDVGKIGIPDAVLGKAGKLDAQEWNLMRRHPTIGLELMREVDLPREIFKGIMEHHERLDGGGYPHGLSAPSRTGKILKIVDVYDALMSRRQYKDAVPTDEVYDLLVRGAGTEFDAEILKVFLKLHFNRVPNS